MKNQSSQWLWVLVSIHSLETKLKQLYVFIRTNVVAYELSNFDQDKSFHNNSEKLIFLFVMKYVCVMGCVGSSHFERI
jgi:hypothetical protein